MREITVTEFAVPGRFLLTAPEGWYNSHDPDVFLLLLNDSLPGSGIFVDYKQVSWPVGEEEQRLAAVSEQFLNDSVIPNSGGECQDAASVSWGDAESSSFRTFVTISRGQTWVFQFVIHVPGKALYLLHWNGDSSLVKSHICPIFDTFSMPETLI